MENKFYGIEKINGKWQMVEKATPTLYPTKEMAQSAADAWNETQKSEQ